MECAYIRFRELIVSESRQVLDRRQRGQGMVEYALVMALIAVVVIVVVSVLGKHVNNVFSNISTDLSSLATGAAKHKKK